MKKTVALMVSFIFLLVSCAGIQIGQESQESQEILTKISAKANRISFADGYPKIAQECLPAAKAFVDKQESYGLFKDFILAVTDGIDDSIIKADIKDLLSIIEIQGPDIPDNYKAVLDSAINGFYRGLVMEGN